MAKVKKRKSILKPLALCILLLALLVAAVYFVGDYLDRREYALVYPDEIRAGADAYGLDRYLVAAVIYAESGSRAEIVSPKGAVGLMQIMPDTGLWIAGKLEDAFTEETLYQPQTNIRYGCWYLNYLLDRFSGNTRHALAAYNAGQGNVDKWLADPELCPEGDLERIPFEETRNYVERVLLARDKYEELYAEELG